MTLYTSADCCLAPKVRATATLCGRSLVEKKPTDANLSGIPVARWPALGTSRGIVCGSNAAMRFLANGYPLEQLYGRSLIERAEVDAFLDAVTAELDTPVVALKRGLVEKERVKSDVTASLTPIDTHLRTATYVVGERLSIGDVALYGSVEAAVKVGLFTHDEFSATFKNVARLHRTVCALAGSQVKPAAAAAAPASAPAAKVAASPKAAAPKAAAPAPAAAAPAKAADEEETPVAAAPKVVDPIDLLPPTQFDMDAWKRHYSNTKDLKGEGMSYLWEKLDREGFTFWKMDYQRYDAEDNTKVFMASNLLGMFLQRCENKLRKYAFAVFNVFEQEGYFDIEGVIMVRGPEIPRMLQEHDQFESFKCTKLCPETDKALIEDYFCEGDEIQGKKIVDAKVYK